MKSINEMREEVLTRAVADEQFRGRMLDDPTATLRDEFGVTLPDDFKLHVHEDNVDVAHLVLPPTGELTAEQLEGVSGGGYTHLWGPCPSGEC